MVLYLEELQWMANNSDDLLSEFKPYWDDALRHNPRLRVVISGSSPSFIVNQFLASRAMYNRSNHMMKLEPFGLAEIKAFLGTGHRELDQRYALPPSQVCERRPIPAVLLPFRRSTRRRYRQG